MSTSGSVAEHDTQTLEHRWGGRFEVDAPALLRAGDGAVADVVVQNASISGAYVLTGLRLPLLSRTWLCARDGAAEWFEAFVVRHDAAGMGLEWLEPGPHVLRAMQFGRERLRRQSWSQGVCA